MRRLGPALLAAGLLLAGCRIEDRTPTGTRRDEEQIRALVQQFYRGTAAHDWRGVRDIFWDSASVELRRAPGDARWHAFGTADDFVLWLRLAYGGREPGALEPRTVRTDFRQQGDVAAVWVSTRLREPGGPPDVESARVDHFVLRRVGSAWRIVHLASVPDGAGRR